MAMEKIDAKELEGGWQPGAGLMQRDRSDGAWPDTGDKRAPYFDLDESFHDDATVVQAVPYPLHAPLIGRSAVFERLQRGWDDVRASRQPAFFLLLGEAGMGKRRILEELTSSVTTAVPQARLLVIAGEGRESLEAPPSPGETSEARLEQRHDLRGGVSVATAETDHAPLAAIARLLAGLLELDAEDDAGVMQAKILASVSARLPAPQVRQVAHLLSHLLRVPLPAGAAEEISESPQRLASRTFLAVRNLIAAEAASRPLLVCLEHLERASAHLVNLLLYLAAGLSGSPVLLLATAQPCVLERHPSLRNADVQRLELLPLQDADAETLLRELCRPLGQVPSRLVAHARKLGGAPRALVELMHLLLETDVIVRSGPVSWRLDSLALARTQFPSDYDELVAARLAAMEPAPRRVLEYAAVLGEGVALDAVLALERGSDAASDPDGPPLPHITGRDEARLAVEAALTHLELGGWLAPGDGARCYRFVDSALVERIAARLPEQRARRLHRIAAQWLELRPSGRGRLDQQRIAHHLERAGDLAGAAARYRRAAHAARAAYSSAEAIDLYQRAFACLDRDEVVLRLHLWHDLGTVYERTGDFQAARAAYERMLRLSWRIAARAKAAVACNKIGRVWRRQGALRLALEYLERAAALFEQARDERGITGSLDDIGHTLYLLGRYDEAEARISAALARRGRDGDARSLAASLSNLGNLQTSRGRYLEAHRSHQEALALWRAAGDRSGIILSQSNLAWLAHHRGELDAARRGWRRAVADAVAIGATPLQALALAHLGELAVTVGHPDEARSLLEEALELAHDLDDRRLTAMITGNLALVENAAGNLAAAERLARQAHAVAAAAELREAEGRALITLGEVLSASLFDAEHAAAPDTERAAASFDAGLAVLRQLGNPSELGRGLERYGRFLAERGDIGAAKDLLREALLLYTKLGTGRAQEVERLLQAV